jgi:hypothetical protein
MTMGIMEIGLVAADTASGVLLAVFHISGTLAFLHPDVLIASYTLSGHFPRAKTSGNDGIHGRGL